jgi:ribonuclease D
MLLRDTIFARASSLGNDQIAREECEVLCDASRYRFDAAQQRLRVRGVEALQPREVAVLVELIKWREHAAETDDVPPRAFVRDSILIAMARNPSRNVAELDRIAGLPRPVEFRWGTAIVEATERGLEAPLPANHVPCDRSSHRRLIDRLWNDLQQSCVARSVHPGIVASKREIAHLVHASAAGIDSRAAAGRLLRGWRETVIGPILHHHHVRLQPDARPPNQ